MKDYDVASPTEARQKSAECGLRQLHGLKRTCRRSINGYHKLIEPRHQEIGLIGKEFKVYACV